MVIRTFMFCRWIHVEVQDPVDHQVLLDLVVPLPVPHDVRLDKVPHLPNVALKGGGHVGGQQETEGEIVDALKMKMDSHDIIKCFTYWR